MRQTQSGVSVTKPVVVQADMVQGEGVARGGRQEDGDEEEWK